MISEQLIGVDIGTSRCRAVLFDITGRTVAQSTRTYPTLNPRPGWHEQEPKAVIRAFLECLQEILGRASRNQLVGIGLSGYLNSILALDRDGQTLGNCMIWTDTRSHKASQWIGEMGDRHALYHHTGCPIHPMYPIAKIRWMHDERPDVFRQADKFVSMKEYVVHEVFGEFVADWSDASGSGLLNIHKKDWDEDALKLVGVKRSQLSIVASPVTRLPRMRPEYASMIGLGEDIPFILGGADGLLSNIGVGAVSASEANNTVGTGGAVRIFVSEPKLDTKMRTWCYLAGPDQWAVGGLSAGGLIYEWFIREFVQAERAAAEKRGVSLYQLLEEYALSVPPGSGGLVFLPFLVGARTPSWNPKARGTLFGLTYHHNRRHLVRALMEGVVYNFFSVFKAVEEVAGDVDAVYVSGGFVHSNTWMQITADVYGRELIVPSLTETTAFGAMFMAMLALRLAKELEDVRTLLPQHQVIYPNPQAHSTYRRAFEKYTRLYRKLEGEF